jgi:branched-chain amino acid aminotransferase
MSDELTVTPTSAPRPRPEASSESGPLLTDHAFHMRSGKRRTWQALTVADRDSIPALGPAAAALLNGQSVTAGFRAHRMSDGSVAAFRPDSHIKRLNNSARRLGLPQVDFDRVWSSVRALLELDQDWLAADTGAVLQLHAVLAAAGDGLVPAPADRCLFYVLASVPPAAPAVSPPLRAMTTADYVRSWPGGTGDTSAVGDIAAGVVPAEVVANYGYDHVLWLDGTHGRFVQQVGNLNVFFVIDGVLTTPLLDRTVFPGITRDSVVKLARDSGAKVLERPLELAEVLKGINDGSVTECFATGTEVGVAPVGVLGHEGVEHTLPNGGTGPVGTEFGDLLRDIQQGRAADRFGWMRRTTEIAPVHA